MNHRIIKNTAGLFPGKIRRLMKPLYNKIFAPTYIVLQPTFQCNYSCPYCAIQAQKCDEKFPKESEHPWTDWVEALDEFPSAFISISGGEPLLYPNLVQLINNLSKKHVVGGITTNLSLPIDNLSNISNKNIDISVSFHSYFVKDASLLKAKILKLKEYGFNVSVNFVAYPKKLHLIEELSTFSKKEVEVPFNVIPYEETANTIHSYTKEETEIFKNYASDVLHLQHDFNNHELKICRAGSKYFQIVPNGNVYPCSVGLYKDLCLGNMFDGSFTPLDKLRICSEPCIHPCDLTMAFPKKYRRVTIPAKWNKRNRKDI